MMLFPVCQCPIIHKTATAKRFCNLHFLLIIRIYSYLYAFNTTSPSFSTLAFEISFQHLFETFPTLHAKYLLSKVCSFRNCFRNIGDIFSEHGILDSSHEVYNLTNRHCWFCLYHVMNMVFIRFNIPIITLCLTTADDNSWTGSNICCYINSSCICRRNHVTLYRYLCLFIRFPCSHARRIQYF